MVEDMRHISLLHSSGLARLQRTMFGADVLSETQFPIVEELLPPPINSLDLQP